MAAGERTRVTPTTIECLIIARHAYELTGGAFDASLGTGLDSLDFGFESSEVRATRDGVKIDLGGVGKGYAVDLMAELLEEWGVERALVHGGFSSVLALEPPSGHDGWPLTLSTPGAQSRVFARVAPRQTAMGASGVRKTDHIVDPRTGTPVRARIAAWVSMPRPRPTTDGPRLAAAAMSDALTTAFMMLPVDEIEELCGRAPGMEAWILERSDEQPVHIRGQA
jgi:thiamine biosynthesis lipoprotein